MESVSVHTVKDYLAGLAIFSSVYWMVSLFLSFLSRDFPLLVEFLGFYVIVLAGCFILFSITAYVNVAVFTPIFGFLSRVIAEKTHSTHGGNSVGSTFRGEKQ